VNECDFVAVEALSEEGVIAIKAWWAADTAMPTRSAARSRLLPTEIWPVHRGTDAGRPWYQDGSFVFLSNGKVKAEALRDISARAWWSNRRVQHQALRDYKPQTRSGRRVTMKGDRPF